MYVKSITLEGFKTFGRRQEIRDFDPEYNAITGLNASGKSNILDAICFVLGISDLNLIRADTLRDLVYEYGHRGIREASVTIVFDNVDQRYRPVGYECNEISVTRQVSLEGESKFLINGVNCEIKEVQDLFSSVQLDVIKPHFLVKQGRIYEVLNMNPMQILRVIEKIADTGEYDMQKQTAKKAILKKEAELKELNQMINWVITPRIEKLQEQQKQCMAYQSIRQELERMTRLRVAYVYNLLLKNVEENGGKLAEIRQKIQDITVEINEGHEEISKIEDSIKKLQKTKPLASRLKDMETYLKKLYEYGTKAQVAIKSIGDAMKSNEKWKKNEEGKLKEEENFLAEKLKEQTKMEDIGKKSREANEKASAELKAAMELYQAVSIGLFSYPDETASVLYEQLIAAKQKVQQAETEKKVSQMKLNKLQKELKEKQLCMKRTQNDYHRDESQFLKKQKDVDALYNELRNVGIGNGECKLLQKDHEAFSAGVRELHKVATVEDRYRNTKEKLAGAACELENMRRALELSEHHQKKEEVEKLMAEIAELKEILKKCQRAEAKYARQVRKLMLKKKAMKEQESKSAEENMKKLSLKAGECRTEWEEQYQVLLSLKYEIGHIQTNLVNMKAVIINREKELEEQNAEQWRKKIQYQAIKEQIETVENELKACKDLIKKRKEDIRNGMNKKDQVKKENNNKHLKIMKLQHRAAQLADNERVWRRRMGVLEVEFNWVSNDKVLFGIKDGPYDYSGVDVVNTMKIIDNLEVQLKEMSYTVNTGAMNMLKKEEEQFAELMWRKKVVQRDKLQIVEVIKDLDQRKEIALMNTLQPLNESMGTIFSSWLGRANARLSPAPGKKLLDGLEIEVCLGGQWKESLEVLSGEQRALAALSFILAISLSSPAPIYILDEADAALNMAGAMNIWDMLKTHFKHSQLIVVSKKAETFNKANVLFRTHFVNGMSTVERSALFGH